MPPNHPPPKVNFDNPNYSVLEDGREPEMLWAGLTIADTAYNKRLKDGEGKSSKRRSLDDMRRLSEHIKRVTESRRK